MAAATAKPTTVPQLDLKRYAGQWFEIARFPNRFQDQCVSDVIAEYLLRDDGRVTVVNRCRKKDGIMTRAEGVARLVDPKRSPSQLKVRFAPAFLSFIPQVWGDYWVFGLAADYRYAVVGSPDLDYLWILSRTAEMRADDYAEARAIAEKNGFDIKRLVATTHGVQP